MARALQCWCSLAGRGLQGLWPEQFLPCGALDLGAASASGHLWLSPHLLAAVLLLDDLSLLGGPFKDNSLFSAMGLSAQWETYEQLCPHQILERLVVSFVVLPLCHQAGHASQPLTFNT